MIASNSGVCIPVPDSDSKRHNWVVGTPKRETKHPKHIPVQVDGIGNITHYQILNDMFYFYGG